MGGVLTPGVTSIFVTVPPDGTHVQRVPSIQVHGAAHSSPGGAGAAHSSPGGRGWLVGFSVPSILRQALEGARACHLGDLT